MVSPDTPHQHHQILLTCRYRGNIHISGPPFRLLTCCTYGRSPTLCNPSLSAASNSSWASEAHPVHQSPSCPSTYISKAVLTARLECFMHPYQRTLLSFSMRFRSSVPSRASRCSSVDLMVTVSCDFTLQICLIIALSVPCRCWRLGLC